MGRFVGETNVYCNMTVAAFGMGNGESLEGRSSGWGLLFSLFDGPIKLQLWGGIDCFVYVVFEEC